ncbi:hypothetical protein [Arthrobacter sp. ISL-28]|uniref:hypothetical protein n=1 Tax=Arthrobacter sp. ISL-28 TaxID=2819108 RepID=UPI001BE86BA6|nr:hypothetical protein [Arthrobacter sp. ISL-28]MBT2522521.1 hypothetical protein [Arthrobacter sp. ISL-28]
MKAIHPGASPQPPILSRDRFIGAVMGRQDLSDAAAILAGRKMHVPMSHRVEHLRHRSEKAASGNPAASRTGADG